MNKEDIKNYFELHVLNYQPYRDIPEYQAIIRTLIDFYFDHSYNVVNLPFKTAFEEQIIPVEFYNNLLLSIGFPKYIISNLTNKDKKILLHSFMDYNRYKGTIDQLRLVGTKFSENVGIYELFIDLKEIEINYYYIYTFNNTNYFNLESVHLYDKLEINDIFTINGVEYSINEKTLTNDGIYRIYLDRIYIGDPIAVRNFKIKRWVFLPEAIFTAPGMTQPPDYFNYESVYRDTKRYFVSAEYLTSQYRGDNLVLPIKSNLLFLDYKKYREVNTFNNLLAAIFLKTFYDERLIIHFTDGDYSISLGKLYKLWYYILMKFYNYDFVDMSPLNIVSLNIYNSNFTYTLTDIPKLIEDYKLVTEYDPEINNIISTSEYSKYYFESISSKLIMETDIKTDLSLNEYKIILENEVGLNLISYIENRIENCGSELKDYEYNFILNEIYDSLITWSIQSVINSQTPTIETPISKNIEYFIKNLSFISYPISMSPTYNLIMFLKPYHVELIKEINEYLKIKDIANSAIIDSSSIRNILLLFLRASTLSISEDIFHTIIYNNITPNNTDDMGAESLTITHGRIYNLKHLIKTFNKVSANLYSFMVYYIEEIIAEPNSVHVIFKLYPIVKDLVFAISNIRYDVNYTNTNILQIANLIIESINVINSSTTIIGHNINIPQINVLDFDSSAYVINDIGSNILYSTVHDENEFYSDPEIYYNEITTCNIIHTYNLI